MARLGPYALLDELGRGAFGQVFRARHETLGVLRAVKVFSAAADPEALARFEREKQALARLQHEGVVSVHESGAEAGRPWFAMDLCPGGSLAARMKREGKYPEQAALALVLALARAVSAIAEAGLVHRDLKPANVLFDDRGRPRLADFGCVRDLGASRLTETGATLGTLAYMAPEQLDGRRVDARADVFALGVILFELVSGARPFEGRSPLELLRAMNAGPPSCPKAGAAVAGVLARALEPDLAKRATPRALARAIEAALAGEKAAPRRRGLAVALVAALSALGVVAFALHAREPAPVVSPPPPLPAPSRPVAAPPAPVATRVPARRRSHLKVPTGRTLEKVEAFFLVPASYGTVSPDDLEAVAAVYAARAGDPYRLPVESFLSYVTHAFEKRWPQDKERTLDELETFVDVAVAFGSPKVAARGLPHFAKLIVRAPEARPELVAFADELDCLASHLLCGLAFFSGEEGPTRADLEHARAEFEKALAVEKGVAADTRAHVLARAADCDGRLGDPAAGLARIKAGFDTRVRVPFLYRVRAHLLYLAHDEPGALASLETGVAVMASEPDASREKEALRRARDGVKARAPGWERRVDPFYDP